MHNELVINQPNRQEIFIERQLLYYDSYVKTNAEFYGCPIAHFNFKNVKTGENVILGSCFFHKEISKIFPILYYRSILDAKNDFDIIWKISDNTINPVSNTLEELQSEYRRMLIEGVSPIEINGVMVEQYSKKQKNR